MSSFKDLRIVDNFYQTSAFYPMPTIMISTLSEDGSTSVGSYSLCFPYYVADRDYYAMILEARNSSNTAKNILRASTCALNFILDDKKYFKEAVRLGFPGDESVDKMKDFSLTFEDGQAKGDLPRPKVIAESFQVFECTWMSYLDGADDDCVQEEYLPPFHDFNGITSSIGAHFILRIDKILMKEKYADSIINGAKAGNFPNVPVDYGYRNNNSFWYTKFTKPQVQQVPEGKSLPVDAIIYAADRISADIKFTDEACATIVKVPSVFLKTVLNSCVNWAKENDVRLITAEHMQAIQENRRMGK